LETIPVAVRDLAARAARSTPEPSRIDSTAARLRRIAMSLPLAAGERYRASMTYWTDALRTELYTADFAASIDSSATKRVLEEPWRTSTASSVLDRILDVDVQTYLPGDLLVKMDIATMAHSLEGRSPFLDHRLMEMAARLPPHVKVNGRTTKVGLKSAMTPLLPKEILHRRKAGFAVPLPEWLRGPLRPTVEEVLLDSRTLSRGQFRRPVVERLLREHVDGRADRSSELWLLLVLELWQRRFLDNERETTLL
jgi:asparagine synthase (glutamine-hydrolysing)